MVDAPPVVLVCLFQVIYKDLMIWQKGTEMFGIISIISIRW